MLVVDPIFDGMCHLCPADSPGLHSPQLRCCAVPPGTVKSFCWICPQKAKLCMKIQRRSQETGHGGDELTVMLSVFGTVGSGG